MILSQDHISLSVPQKGDLDHLLDWENDQTALLGSQNTGSLSSSTLEAYVNSIHDIYLQKQLKLMVRHRDYKTVGMVDLFEFDAINRKCGLGIYIAQEFRQKNLASQAMIIVQNYARDILNLNMIWCSVLSNNNASLRLFEKLGYSLCGIRRQWVIAGDKVYDEHMFQLML